MIHSLTTFLLATILALAFVPAPQTQKKPPPQAKKTECGTVVSPEQIRAELARRSNAKSNAKARAALIPDQEGALYLPLTIHMVRDNQGTGGLSSAQLEAVMQTLNRMWRPMNIQFFIYGEVDFSIHNRDFFFMPNVRARQDELRKVNVVPNTINVYFTNLSDITGIASFTTDDTQGILVDYMTMRGFGLGGYGPEIFAHEIGHYFDLYHTHETGFGIECPNGNNCSSAGDQLCDTPADPKLDRPHFLVDGNCTYDNSVAPPASCDGTPYNPSTRNLMSYSRGACLNEFTPEQVDRAWNTLYSASNRKNLIDSGKFYVDPQASNSNTKCTASAPCRTVAKAISAAQDGAFIYLKPGVHPVSEISGKKLTLKKWGEGSAAELRP